MTIVSDFCLLESIKLLRNLNCAIAQLSYQVFYCKIFQILILHNYKYSKFDKCKQHENLYKSYEIPIPNKHLLKIN